VSTPTANSESNDTPINVTIIGGGCAGVAAAFELTRPEHNGRYRVTLYQLGWRLGGKGASGRGRAGRIEEHGLHLWMGFYENAFRLLRECYAELDRQPGTCPFVDWQDAFYPAPLAGLADRSADGQWSTWTALLPPGGGLPGDPGRSAQRWTMADYVLRSVSLIASLLERIASPRAGAGPRHDSRGSALDGSPDVILGSMLQLAGRLGPLASLSVVIESMRVLRAVLGTLGAYPAERVEAFYLAVEQSARAQLQALTRNDDDLRRVWEIVDILLAVVRGSLRDGLLLHPDGFDAIEHHDCREWLQANGASSDSVNSAFVRGLHDLALAYEDGDSSRMTFAAGAGLRGAFRAFFNYRGSFFWKMRAGMGDVVFAPFFEVLKKRGVRFEFFHRLRNVRLSKESDTNRPYVEALEFDVQAETIDGQEYAPLVDVRGLPCWPSTPNWAQLANGERMAACGIDFESHWEEHRAGQKVLRVTEDFDFVILSVGLGAVPYVCQELVARDPRWRAMVEHVSTVSTQAFQIWMNQDMKSLGWEGTPLSSLSAFVDPFGTWADMTQLVRLEDWPDPPQSIAYFCGVLDSPPDGNASAQRERVRRAAIQFLNHDIGRLWPRSERGRGEFRWELLVDPDGTDGSTSNRVADERRFDSQYWTANVNPSDRYVQSVAGSASHRISPLDEQFSNLTVAGDWTNNSLNIGCVEAAIMSGRLAAHALSKCPALEDIPGFDHP
jgi:uncharacterized protein with NAD-binding domain and iron-sulfur cluster